MQHHLSEDEKMQAIGFLASGFNFSQRAPSFGVDRSTVSHWCHKFCFFIFFNSIHTKKNIRKHTL